MPLAPAAVDVPALRARFESLDPSSERFAIEFVDAVLAMGDEAAASDVHLRPEQEGLHVLARTGGVLRSIARGIPLGDRIVTRTKVLAGLLTYRSDLPQEGRIVREGHPSIRLASCPTVQGEKAVLRWTASTAGMRLDDLGFDADTLAAWREMLAAPQGLLLVTGPAGSGKTTTAYASLRHLQASEDIRSLVSLEDPVEGLLDGVAQTQVDSSSELGFAEGLRAILRHDPEVLLVGEIRDADTLATAIRGALTGHLILSTLHTSSPAEAITRLLDMRIEPYLIASSLIGVLQQRLVRTVDGGRRLLVERLDLRDDALTDLIKSHPTTRQIADAAGGRTVVDQARDLVAGGTITQAEFVRVFGLASVPS